MIEYPLIEPDPVLSGLAAALGIALLLGRWWHRKRGQASARRRARDATREE